MSDDDYEDAGGQVFGESFNDRNRAQTAAGDEYTDDPRTEEGKWNNKIRNLSRTEHMTFSDIKQTADQITNYLNLNPYTFVFAYMIVNFTGEDPINKDMLTSIEKKLKKNSIEHQPFKDIMNLSDVIRYAFLIRETSDKIQVLV